MRKQNDPIFRSVLRKYEEEILQNQNAYYIINVIIPTKLNEEVAIQL